MRPYEEQLPRVGAKSQGWVEHTRPDTAVFHGAMLRAKEWLVEVDESRCRRPDRESSTSRGFSSVRLMTDPDFHEGISTAREESRRWMRSWRSAKGADGRGRLLVRSCSDRGGTELVFRSAARYRSGPFERS